MKCEEKRFLGRVCTSVEMSICPWLLGKRKAQQTLRVAGPALHCHTGLCRHPRTRAGLAGSGRRARHPSKGGRGTSWALRLRAARAAPRALLGRLAQEVTRARCANAAERRRRVLGLADASRAILSYNVRSRSLLSPRSPETR